jgi:hypothetical protein
MSVRRVIRFGPQLLSGFINGVARNPFVLKMGIPKRKTPALRLLLGRRHLSAATGSKQYFQFSWHLLPLPA